MTCLTTVLTPCLTPCPTTISTTGLSPLEGLDPSKGLSPLEGLSSFVEDAYSPNTVATLTKSFNLFTKWATENDFKALPASPNAVVAYLRHRALTVNHRTVRIDLWAIGKTHIIAKLPSPIKNTLVLDTMKAIVRKGIRDKGETTNQAEGLNWDELKGIVEKIRHTASDEKPLLAKRNACILALSYGLLLRSDEVRHIKLNDLIYDGERYYVRMTFSKTNKTGKEEMLAVPTIITPILEDYLKTLLPMSKPHEKAMLFTGVSKHGGIIQGKKPISYGTVLNLYKEYGYTAHSTRVGATQDLIKKGASVAQVAIAGRWSSDAMVLRYGKKYLQNESIFDMMSE